MDEQSTPAPAPKNHTDLGRIVLAAVGEAACESGYGTTDPYWVGRYALGYGDIDQEGNLS